jgi:hypothetical protein
MAARFGGRPNGCMRDLSDNHAPGDNTDSLARPDTNQGFLAGDHPPPLVGVKFARPRLRRQRLRLRALQLDTSHADGEKPASYEEARTTVTPPPGDARRSRGQGGPALLTRPALMGAETQSSLLAADVRR